MSEFRFDLVNTKNIQMVIQGLAFFPQILHFHLNCNRFCNTDAHTLHISTFLRKTDLFVR